ncbi:hypothetical protein B0J11DRAFT_586195 [Dendryphion nanum]|uniref:DUF4188 domain-containing protein n=1 Tax=Dendryphion nanum TaxID=256645 RepID=A0A9P9I8N0_9PLEO|nr:hypothetical protein B0J11DRAFT_586195 [Dendryphion nanum]
MVRKIPLIVNDFALSTWLILGALLQSFSVIIFPYGLAIRVPFILLLLRLFSTYHEAQGYLASSGAILRGRWTARVAGDDAENTSKDRVVVFILGARTLHPMGRLANGFKESRTVFADMWDDAETNREKWGYLGRTEPLISETHGGMNIVWLTYWRDLDGLRAFAAGDSHHKGWNAYLAKEFPNLGIMHETYHALNGSWENIYHSWPAFGIGETTWQLGETNIVLTEAKNPRDRSLFSRMGRECA